MGDHYNKWRKALAAEPTESWHLTIIQVQFIHQEAEMLRRDFIANCMGKKTSGVSREDRILVARHARDQLRRHGVEPRISAMWMPELFETIGVPHNQHPWSHP